MEALNAFRHGGLLASKLKSISLVKVYLLTTGRNAWHGTWSNKYNRHRAIFESYTQATTVAESLRTQGTQFYLKQIPALAFISLDGVIVTTEFHSDPQYRQLNISRISSNLVLGGSLIESIKPFRQASSDFWNAPFPDRDSFITVIANLSDTLEIYSDSQYLKKWQSVSSGPNYYLNWEEKNIPEKEPLESIMDEFKRVNSIQQIIDNEFELELKRKELMDGVTRENRETANRLQLKKSLDNWFEQNGIENLQNGGDDQVN